MGAVIGPNHTQYQLLQGKIKAKPREIIATKAQGAEGVADIYLLPSIKPAFKTSGAFWAMDMGRVDANDLFLIDSQVNTQNVAQFFDCIWYDPNYSGRPLIDTRPQQVNQFGQDSRAFEMGYYLNRLGDPFPAPKPEQFRTIDLSAVNLKTATQLTSKEFLNRYGKLISKIPNATFVSGTPKPIPPNKTPKTSLSASPQASTADANSARQSQLATTACTTGKATQKAGTWTYRPDLLQTPAGAKATAADPYVSITALQQNDPLTGTTKSNTPTIWAVVFAADNIIGAKLQGQYKGNSYTYSNETANLYRDTNNNNLFDPGDAAIGVVPRQTGATDIINANYFNAATLGSGSWCLTPDNKLTLFSKDLQQSFGPTPLAPGMSI